VAIAKHAGGSELPTGATASAMQAQVAELASRLLRSLEVGRIGRNGHVVRMRLCLADGGELLVTLEEQNGHMAAVFDAEPEQRSEAQQIADVLGHFMGTRGVALESSVVIA